MSALVGRVTTFVALLAVGACGTKVTPPPELGAIDLTCRLPLVDGPKVECALEVREHAGRVLYEDHAMVDRLEGSSSPFVKPSYEMELRDLVGANLSANFFGMGADGDWVLDGFESDRSMMRSALIYDSFRAVGGGRYAPEGRYCTLSLNGVDQGLYRLVEKIKRDDDRVDIAADDGSGTSFVVESSNADDGALPNGLGMKWEFVSPSDASVTHRQRDGLESWLTAIDDTLASATPADVFKHIDRDALADWILIEELAKNLHGFSRGVYFSRDAGRPARLVPWDIDLSFGQPTITDDVAIPPNDSPEGWIPERPDFIHELARSGTPPPTTRPRRTGRRATALRTPTPMPIPRRASTPTRAHPRPMPDPRTATRQTRGRRSPPSPSIRSPTMPTRSRSFARSSPRASPGSTPTSTPTERRREC